MPLKKILLISLIVAVIGVVIFFGVVYFSEESLSAGLARTEGKVMVAAVFLAIFIVTALSIKLLIRSSVKSKVLYTCLLLVGLLLWYEYETAQVSMLFMS